ncbi:unnamed protein product [Rhizoctonia solani]|uniref:HORMA domain-containing protein n=1 Tax=Rhizoctonia solani TaxID=456999 RepID=A0A8H2WZU6_9AGAM|nr:unnamed protein product [Rhizoctonia solani]
MSAPNAPPDLTASGSPATIIEFLYYAVNSILFYRGVYESEDFRAVNKYEQDLVLVRDGEVTQFLDRFFKQVEGTCVNSTPINYSPIGLYQNGSAKNSSTG